MDLNFSNDVMSLDWEDADQFVTRWMILTSLFGYDNAAVIGCMPIIISSSNFHWSRLFLPYRSLPLILRSIFVSLSLSSSPSPPPRRLSLREHRDKERMRKEISKDEDQLIKVVIVIDSYVFSKQTKNTNE